jgi:hypothetical protein
MRTTLIPVLVLTASFGFAGSSMAAPYDEYDPCAFIRDRMLAEYCRAQQQFDQLQAKGHARFDALTARQQHIVRAVSALVDVERKRAARTLTIENSEEVAQRVGIRSPDEYAFVRERLEVVSAIWQRMDRFDHSLQKIQGNLCQTAQMCPPKLK